MIDNQKSKDGFIMSDPYLYPKTKVLKNKHNIRDRKILADTERNLSQVRSGEIAVSPTPQKFNLEYLKEIHKTLFSELYEWAGETRTVNITKGDTTFCFAEHVDKAADKLFKELSAEDNLRNKTPEKFAERASYYLGEINQIHPFREGNGRTQRVFIEKLAEKAKHKIFWPNISQKEMVEASKAAASDLNYKPLQKLITKSLVPLEKKRDIER